MQLRFRFLSTCAVLGISTSVQAQTAPVAAAAEPNSALEEVTVTAEKRSENAQRVPIAISAFTAETIQGSGISSVQQLGSLSPGVTLDQTAPFAGSNNVLSASIRGVGQDDFAFNLDNGVAIYVDGVYLARDAGANQDLLDVERIEILKGPQGSLFGRNSVGGAINIVTQAPGNELKLTGAVTVGARNRRDVDLLFNVPIADNLSASLVVADRQQDGYQKIYPYPGVYTTDPITSTTQTDFSRSTEPRGGKNNRTLRAKLLWTATDALSFTVSGDWSHENTTAQPVTNLAQNPSSAFNFLYDTCITNTAATLEGMGLGPICNLPRGQLPPLAGANLGSAPPRQIYSSASVYQGIDGSYGDGLNFSHIDSYGGSLTANWQVADSMSLKSISAYRALRFNTGDDEDGTSLLLSESTFAIYQHQVSEELQLTGSAFDNRLKYTSGLYYFHEAGQGVNDVVLTGAFFQAANLPGTPFYTSLIDTNSYAAYAHLNYAITDKLGITAGERYTSETKEVYAGQAELNALIPKLNGCFPSNPACLAALGFPRAAENNPYSWAPATTGRVSFHPTTPTLGAEYQFTPDIMSYFSYSKGFKSGGLNERLNGPVITLPSFNPETNKSYELGLKSEWLERRLRFNGAVFYEQYNGIQLSVESGNAPSFRNAGDARIKGAEEEITWIPFGGFTLSQSLSYLDAYYVDVDPGAGIPVTNKLPKTPKWKWTLSPAYVFELGSHGSVRIGTDFTKTSSVENDIFNDAVIQRATTNILNAQISYRTEDRKYEVALGGTNITNDRYLITGWSNPNAGFFSGTYNPPGEWYLRIKASL